MASRRPGIFDPWRQETPRPEATEPPPDADPEGTNVSPAPTTRFAGRKAGVIVRAHGAEQLLVSAVMEALTDPALQESAARWNISDKPPLQVHSVLAGSLYVVGDYPAAIDAIAFVLRDAARLKPAWEKRLTALGIRPYIR